MKNKTEKQVKLIETPVLWIDMDGTVRWGRDEMGGFARKPAQVRVFDEVPEILTAYKRAGWRIVGVSNQGDISLGIYTNEQCAACMEETNRQCGHVFDDMQWCPHWNRLHMPQTHCWCRKPNIGMLVKSATLMTQRFNEAYPLYLGRMVGDRPDDRNCAKNAGVRFMDAKDWRAGGWREWLDTGGL